MTREDVLKMQTYKMFENDKELYVSRDDVLKALQTEHCEDVISRQAVLDILDRHTLSRMALYEIEDLPSVQPEQKWIPCSERLPEMPTANELFENKELELYLVTISAETYPFRAFWNGKFFTDGWSKVEPIAWMPLPKPYKESEDKE